MHGAEDLHWLVFAAHWAPRVLACLLVGGAGWLLWRWIGPK